MDLRDRLRAERDDLAGQIEAKKVEVRARSDDAVGNRRASAVAELERTRATLATMTEQREVEAASFEKANNDATGLVARREASAGSRIAPARPTAPAWRSLSSSWPSTPWPCSSSSSWRSLRRPSMSGALPASRTTRMRCSPEELEDRRQLIRLESEPILEEARVRHDLEVDLATRIATRTVDARERLYDEIITEWEARQLQTIRANIDDYITEAGATLEPARPAVPHRRAGR